MAEPDQTGTSTTDQPVDPTTEPAAGPPARAAEAAGADAASPLQAPVGGTAPAEAAAPAPDPKSRLGIGGWLAIAWIVGLFLAALLAPLLPIADPSRGTGTPRAPMFTDGHVFGTDMNGRDVLSRTIWGARISLLIGVTAVALGMLVGGALGLYSGYYRNKLATLIAWLFDVILAFPAIVLALSLVAILASGPDVTPTQRDYVLIIALGIVSIPILGRITRANTLSWAQREFVLAARSLGAKDLRIVAREVLPNVLPAMFSIALLGIAVTIVAEGGLAVIGVGSENISWGNLIARGRNNLRDLPHVVFVPSAAIFFTVLALNYLGDVVRARFDVRESML